MRNAALNQIQVPVRGIMVDRADLALTPNTPSLYGCEPLFNLDADDALLSLSFAGMDPFLDWIGWTPSNECLLHRYFLNFVRAKYSGGNPTPGWLADPCDDPNTFEFDVCDFTIKDFARLRRAGPVRDTTKTNMIYTYNQPRYRLDGSLIANDREFDLRLAMEVVMQDLRDMVINGDVSVPGQFDGLKQLIKIDYENSDGTVCKMMDSIVVDWSDNPISGGSGATWNGASIAADVTIVDVLLAAYRRIRRRIRMAPSLNSQGLKEGDIVLVLPSDFINCILDAYTCWSVCAGDQSLMDTFEARTFRNGLQGGMFGGGTITLDGFRVPLMPFDYGTIVSGTSFDMYMLTGAVGTVKTLHGQYNDMSAASIQPNMSVIDGGRILTWERFLNTCDQQFLEMQPRLIDWAPWAQASISNVQCLVPGGIESDDPNSEYFPY